MTIVNLILYNPSSQYDGMKDCLTKYLKYIGVVHYFYCYKDNITEDFVFNDNILYIKGKETFLPGIFKKTVKAISICLEKFQFTHIVRTNISTICNFKLLNEYLSQQNIIYGGTQVCNLGNRLDKWSGIYDYRYRGTKFIHGTGIIIDRQRCELIVEKENEVNYDVIDDVGIALFYAKYGIYPEPLKKYRYVRDVQDFIADALFYRNKRDDRNADVDVMKNITTQMIEIEKIEM